MMMVECPSCHTLCDQGAEFCSGCGARLPDVVMLVSDRQRGTPRPTRAPKRPSVSLDPHGQPVNANFNRARRTVRDLSEMLGLVKGMLVDGVVTDEEAQYLHAWGMNHPDTMASWPARLIFTRLEQYFSDGRIDETERAELQTLLAALVGGTASLLLGYEGATTLPLDTPPPLICWGPDEVYVFTGRFAYGTRADLEREATSRQSSCEQNVTRRTSFLVIGTFGSEDWAHTSYGRKIQRAVKLRESGFALRIVGEDHWATSLSVVGS